MNELVYYIGYKFHTEKHSSFFYDSYSIGYALLPNWGAEGFRNDTKWHIDLDDIRKDTFPHW